MSVSASTQPPKSSPAKAKVVSLKDKEPKEKRDAPSSAPYSYETPQKPFQSPVHINQQKHTSIEHYGPQHKVAPLEYIPRHEAPQQQQQQQVYHEQQQYHPTSFSSPMGHVEHLFSEHPVKEIEDYSFNYPHFEAFSQYPGEYEKVIAVPVKPYSNVKQGPSYSYPAVSSYNYQAPSHSYQAPSNSYQANSQSYQAPAASHSYQAPASSHSYQAPASSYSYQAPASSYSYPQPSASYNYPQQQQHSYSMANYAPSIPAHYTTSFTQSPAAIFIPQSVSVAHKQVGKVPDYAQGSKGLSHFSTVASLAPVSSSYKNQHHEVPSYAFSQTERPFKPSTFLGASQVASHNSFIERPSNEHYTPSKSYLPAKEYQYAQQYAAPVEYQVQYVQIPAGKSTYQPAPSNSYLPSKHIVESPKNNYLPPPAAPTKTYLPAVAPIKVEQPKNSYLPPQNSYLPPSNPYAQSSQQQYYQQQYAPQSHETYESAEYQSGHK